MSDTPSTRSRKNGGVPWKLVLWGALAVYAVVFLLMNAERQDVSFVFFTVKTRLIWLILLSMAIGAVLGTVGRTWWQRRGSHP
jgi:uncharacterized integral membrane protein